jgi:hypothetical protein
MVYNTPNYWGFVIYPLTSILETRKHDVLETSCFVVARLQDDGKSPKTQ